MEKQPLKLRMKITNNDRKICRQQIFDHLNSAKKFLSVRQAVLSGDELMVIADRMERFLFKKTSNALYYKDTKSLPFKCDQIIFRKTKIDNDRYFKIINFNNDNIKVNFLENIKTIINKCSVVEDMDVSSIMLSNLLCRVNGMFNGLLEEPQPGFVKHMMFCRDKKCKIKTCNHYKFAIKHFYFCKNYDCNGCAEIRKFYVKDMLLHICSNKKTDQISIQIVKIVENHYNNCKDRNLCGCEKLYGCFFKSHFEWNKKITINEDQPKRKINMDDLL